LVNKNDFPKIKKYWRFMSCNWYSSWLVIGYISTRIHW